MRDFITKVEDNLCFSVQSVSSWQQRKQTAVVPSLWGCRVKTAPPRRTSQSTKFVSPRFLRLHCLAEAELSWPTTCVFQDAPLSSVFSQYVSAMPAGTQRRVRFLFDGARLTGSQTPAQLDMEDGDIIEAWTWAPPSFGSPCKCSVYFCFVLIFLFFYVTLFVNLEKHQL